MLAPEEEVAFDRKPKWPAHRADFGKADIAEFGFAKAKVAEAEEPVGVFGIGLGEQPGSASVRCEKLHDRARIDVFAGGAASAIGKGSWVSLKFPHYSFCKGRAS